MTTLTRVLCALSLLALSACDADAGQTGSAQPEPSRAVASAEPPPAIDACLACHAGPMGFAGRDSGRIAASLRDIVSGNRPHPPLGLEDTSDAALEALADRLTTP